MAKYVISKCLRCSDCLGVGILPSNEKAGLLLLDGCCLQYGYEFHWLAMSGRAGGTRDNNQVLPRLVLPVLARRSPSIATKIAFKAAAKSVPFSKYDSRLSLDPGKRRAIDLCGIHGILLKSPMEIVTRSLPSLLFGIQAVEQTRLPLDSEPRLTRGTVIPVSKQRPGVRDL